MWWCIILKLLLISNNKKLFDLTYEIIGSEHELIWENYTVLDTDKNLSSDIVILHFTEMMMREGRLIPLIKIKIKLGQLVPILAVVEGGTPQQIFSVLRSGAYDYVDILNRACGVYRQKIDDIAMWKWYLKKYGNAKKNNG